MRTNHIKNVSFDVPFDLSGSYDPFEEVLLKHQRNGRTAMVRNGVCGKAT